MGQALYRKYRSRSLDEIVGQEHITKTLKEALKQGRMSHAYLLTGPRGVGKTSIARILAHEINGLPYDDDSTHIDIIEIDAASNRRIDEIRDLRDKVYIAPAESKYKVYIIDEVHMLTREAFNALLKTLEEPPEHVVFILATTDAHKLPETIISRTQRFSFKPVEKSKVVEHLADIAKQEKIKVSPAALELLAEHGEGSFRDSISMLDQAASQGSAVELDDVRRLLGVPPQEAIDALIDLLARNADAAQLITGLSRLYDQGYQAAAVAVQLGRAIRKQLLTGQSELSSEQALQLLTELLKVPASHDPERFLEIVLLSVATPVSTAPATPSAEKTEKQPAAAEPAKVTPSVPVTEPEETHEPEPTKLAARKPAATAKKANPGSSDSSKADRPLNAELWPAVLSALKRKHNTIYSVVRMARPVFPDDDTVELVFGFAFHQKRLKEAANRRLVSETLEELVGRPISVECTLDETTSAPHHEPVPAGEEPQEFTAISNIFGGGELLES